jgi:hypothetical protein
MVGINDRDVIQAFTPDGSNPAYSIWVCIWCLIWGMDDMNTLRLEDSIKGFVKLTIIVPIHGQTFTYDFPEVTLVDP